MHVRTKYWEYNKKISGITIVNSGVNIKRVYRMQLHVVRLKFSFSLKAIKFVNNQRFDAILS